MVEATAIPGASAAPRKPWYTVLYIQVLIAIALGVAVGHFIHRPAMRSNRSATRSST